MTATDHPVISPKKLIEVALPLDAINTACAREKSIRHGHPSTLHLWWARRPLAAARAVIFGQLVHDPEDLWRTQNPGIEPKPQNKSAWTRERARLFKIIEDLVLWENTTNEDVLEAARAEIQRSWAIACELNKDHPQATELFNPEKMPSLHDPFAGGGAIPLEAQRLGLESRASDLNPVAVLINKAMIEIPPKFAGRPPVHPGTRMNKEHHLRDWKGAAGLAEDVRRYGQWMRDEAEKRIGHLYPKVAVTNEMAKDRPDLKDYVGQELTVIAWLWARTVKSPNPAFSHVDVPLVSTFVLSKVEAKRVGKSKKAEAFLEPSVDTTNGTYCFAVQVGKPPQSAAQGTRAGGRGAFRCLMSSSPIDYDYIREEAQAGRMGSRLLAIAAEGNGGRVYIPAENDHTSVAQIEPGWRPTCPIAPGMSERVVRYGLCHYGDLFTPRQLAALVTLTDLVCESRELILADAIAAGVDDDDKPLDSGGHRASAYAEAVSVYLALTVSKLADLNSSLCRWKPDRGCPVNVFSRQALPMVWDYAEANLFSESSGSWFSVTRNSLASMSPVCLPARPGHHIAQQLDVRSVEDNAAVFSTDPPYYDNIGYADLSDFFYLWLRRSLRGVFPTLFATMAVPKDDELVATPVRHGTKANAEQYFLQGMTRAMHQLATCSHPAIPVTIYYAFKQSETKHELGTSSSGWDAFLTAVVRSGFAISGTWPLRTEMGARQVARGTNALASSIVLVCRPRPMNAGAIDRRRFQRLLNETLPLALDAMTRESEGLHSPVAPVDLSQAIIGPGMAIFSRYEAVLEADGTPMTVRTALQLINRFLAEDDFDADTQFCLHWFEQHGWNPGKFGEADTLARAKGTSVDGVKHAGVAEAVGGSVRLLRWREYPADWDPRQDNRLPVWEALHHMIRVYQTDGDSGAATVLAGVARLAEPARQLAYRLYTLCERKGWAEDARAYNAIVAGWSAIELTAVKVATPEQRTLFDIEEVAS
jgi:putative DNA methylase